MNTQSLENHYETTLLSQYTTEDLSAGVTWKDHGKVDNAIGYFTL